MTLPVVAPQQAPNLTPADLPSAFRLADMMANASLVPKHLQGKPADCLLVIEQAVRWGMSPFAVAQATSVIGGKLMYEGKLVAAAVNTSGILSDRLAYSFTGTGDQRTVTVRGTIRGEANIREAAVTLRDVRTENAMWKRQPDQQLIYSGARVWARRHAPEVMLGVYTPDEFDEAPAMPTPTKAEALAKWEASINPTNVVTGKTLAEEEWLDKIANAQRLDDLGLVSQAIHKANLPNDVLAQLRAAFIKRKVELTPTTQHDPETGEIQDPAPQGSPPAGAEPEPAEDTAEPAEAAPAPSDTPERARERGVAAFHAGASRRAIPGEYRGTPHQLEWQDGYDAAKQEAGSAD